MKAKKIYPQCCTSAYCGELPASCPGCKNYPKLQEFKQWVKENNATQSDPIWCPSVYVANHAN